MSTITIRLPDRLKVRVAAAAKRAGKTMHGFILEAITEKTDDEKRRRNFHRLAEKRYAGIIATGETIPWNKMRAHLKKRLAGKKPRRPSSRKLAR